ncbi:MAG: AraC family transcriptional regulator [Comamonas sp.]
MSALSMTPRIRSISLNKYAQVAQEFGLDPLRMLRQAGLDHSCLNSPDLQVPETAFAQMLETSSAHAGNAALGLLMGAYWKLSDFGPISLLLQHQASLAALLQTLKDYPHLISSTITTEIVTQQRLSIIQLHLRTERDTPGRHPMELGIAALLSLCRHQLGRDWNPVSVHFTHSAPASSAQHRRVLGCETVFASHFDGIVLSNQDLQLIDPEYDHHMEGHARQLIDAHAPRPSSREVEQRVQNTLQSLLPHGRHGIAQVASALGCTSRSLQRQLEGRNTSFQETLDAVRSQAAVRALKNPHLSVSEAAALSGFAENSSFTRWFSKHFQQSPSQWRLQHLSGPG